MVSAIAPAGHGVIRARQLRQCRTELFELMHPGREVAADRQQQRHVIRARVHGNGVRPDITTVPLEGVEPSHVVLACRAGDRSGLLAAFRKIAEAVLIGPAPV